MVKTGSIPSYYSYDNGYHLYGLNYAKRNHVHLQAHVNAQKLSSVLDRSPEFPRNMESMCHGPSTIVETKRSKEIVSVK